MSELMPCPFCKSRERKSDNPHVRIVVHEKDCIYPHSNWDRETWLVDADDVARWNRRTPPIVGEDARDAIQRVIDQATTFIDSQPNDSPLRKQWQEWRNGMVLAYNALAAQSRQEAGEEQ